MSFACRNFPRSAIQAQEEVLDPCCEPYAQSSPSLAFFTGSKKAAHYKVIRWLRSLAVEGSQSSLTSVDELQISLVGELSSAIILILMRRAGNSHSVETSETDSGQGRVAG